MMPADRHLLETLIFGSDSARRFTQDSPILPDVWIAYGTHPEPNPRLDLLLTPHRDATPGQLYATIRRRLEKERGAERTRSTDAELALAYNQSTVVARLTLEELIRVVLPLSSWWSQYVGAFPGGVMPRKGERTEHRRSIRSALELLHAGQARDRAAPSLLWLARIVGTILDARDEAPGTEAAVQPVAHGADALARVVEETPRLLDAFSRFVQDMEDPAPEEVRLLYMVSHNRKARASLTRSALSVKADAARRVFQLSCADLAWAVIDSGIDATHPAFRLRDGEGTPYAAPFERQGKGSAARWTNRTRIVETYDFRRIRELLAAEGGVRALQTGRALEWDRIAPRLMIKHTSAYDAPRHSHGTHVAGILAGDWRQEGWEDPEDAPAEDLVGLCPDLRLYDLRVLDENGEGDEFSVMAALQFIRHLNAHREQPVIHGVNLSLSIRHDVANYACGRTPVCEECERVVSTGVVTVAAAGNDGYTPLGLGGVAAAGVQEGYRSISISDPGNAEGVITVGATHRFQPHTYGVSYFSSRGPTGDGRMKPDLVAPGEKVTAPVPGRSAEPKDGTSMAAPHVSGAAALLMARHRELLGRPARIKSVLCATATDLGRERYFQGAGMLDILRALQSI